MNEIYGIDILTSKDIMEASFSYAENLGGFCLFCSFICLIVLLGIFLKFGIIKYTLSEYIAITIFSMLAVVLFVISLHYYGLSKEERPSGIKEYKATISEDANFLEIHDRFDIVDQDGKLYTLRDKEPQ